MILLNGHTLTPTQIFAPESMSLSLTENAISTASLTLGPDAPELKIDDWLLDNVEPGKGIVWRVKALDTVFETHTRTVQLEHVLATLRDALLFGEITTKAMAGSNTSNVSAERALRYVLGRQSIWALGAFEFSRSLPYSFNNQTIYNALETICSTLDGWRWEYDLSALPFKLHIRKQRSDLGGEIRMGRNLLTLKRTVDRTSMYTRFYPVGARNMHIDGSYVSRNESLYGVVSKTETDQSISNKNLLRAWAEDRLSRHCEPNVTVSISALELAEATGETLDRFTLGYPCRVPLPEYNTTILERVTRLNWSDKLREPERVTVTLANQANDVTTIIKQLSSSGGRNSGGSAKTQEEDHAWIVDTSDHVGLVAEAIIGKDGETVDWSRVSSIIVDGEGIHQQVVKTQGDLVVTNTRIDMNERAITLEATRAATAESKLTASIKVESNRITSEVTNRQNADNTLSSRITQTANAISSEVTARTNADTALSSRITQNTNEISAEVTNRQAADTALSGRITVNSDKVSLVVKETSATGSYEIDSASIVLGINSQSGSYVKIQAAKINLSGYVTATELNATNATIQNLTNGTTQANHLDGSLVTGTTVTARNSLIANTNFSFKNHAISFKTITIDGTTYHLMGYT